MLIRLISGLGGDDALLTGGPGLEAQVLLYNTVFLYVYLTSVVGAGASTLGKTVKLLIVRATRRSSRQCGDGTDRWSQHARALRRIGICEINQPMIQ